MTQRKRLVGQIQEPGQRPRDVVIVGREPDPLFYKIRHLVVSSSSGTLTLNLNDALSFECTLTENITSVDVNGSFVDNEYWEFKLRLIQDSTARTITWPAAFKFAGGTDHSMSTGSGDIDIVHCYTDDGGTSWYCTFAKNLS